MLHLFAIALLSTAAPANVAPTASKVEVQRDTAIQAGTYDLAIVTGGGQIEATLEISYVRDSLTVKLLVGDHESPVKPGTRRGNRLTLEPQSAAINVKYDLEFKGNDITGTFVYQGDTGTVTGKRRAGR